jgi:hypothetical protein
VTRTNDAVAIRAEFHVPRHSLPALRYGRTYNVRLRAVDLAGNSVPFDAADRITSGVSQEFTYRRFDPVNSPDVLFRVDPEADSGENIHTLVIRSNFDVPCTGICERHLAPPRSAEESIELHGKIDRNGHPRTGSYGFLRRADAVAGPTAVKRDDYRAEYLWDPLCAGIRLRDLPGPLSAVAALFTEKTSEWPDHHPIRIRIVEQRYVPGSDSAPYYLPVEVDDGVVTIHLPKAEDREVSLTSHVRESDMDLLGVWHLLASAFPESVASHRRQIIEGGLPLVTPAKKLRLVHAVRQPLFPPGFWDDAVTIARALNDSGATLQFDARLPGRSAGTFSLHARWVEVDDEQQQEQRAQVFERQCDARDATVAVTVREDFPDTKHRLVHYQLEATSRFRQFFPPSKNANAPMSRISRTVSAHVPNSSRPPAPRVRYILPLYGWEPLVRVGQTIRQTRRGGGIRIYLDRPWRVTGEDELLGVIVALQGDAAALSGQVSECGCDPIQGTSRVAQFITAQQVSGSRTNFERTVTLGDGARARVVGYKLEFAPDRKLWWVDIVVTPQPAYGAFARFALARFQPFSIDGCHLSETILADFIQLTADRSASMLIDPVRPFHLENVTLDTPLVSAMTRVEVVIEQKRVGIADEAGWQPVGAPVPMGRTNTGTGSSWTAPIIDMPAVAEPIRVSIREYEQFTADRPGAPPDARDERLVGVYVLTP